MAKESLEAKVKELVELDKEIVSKINELKSMMAQNERVKDYVV